MITDDPITTNPQHYRLLWENEFVRVLEYFDSAGVQTVAHEHPNSVMITLSAFDLGWLRAIAPSMSRSLQERRCGCPRSGIPGRTPERPPLTRSSSS